ncbi:hypothetical protein Cob_v001405 [Colletotrichum orbiculare MAFF 240422]|uniref:Uncharacterized protein n=1 Tax=Colletotrichum orbiculare (strain 104-T / ATCC 96160 / CBS 514.97 / LARS 414 / MAFF 240422) TaxID=1213857 RepID=A0A484G676_COLOR|nr:hypothetical protein Cob_v001405 [Colletotrichum orbiculare MAFF 240422]
MAPSFIEASESSKQGVRQFTFRMPHKRSSDKESGASENEAWSDNESQVDSSASGASSPGLAPETRSPQFPPHSRDITENPFDSESRTSRCNLATSLLSLRVCPSSRSAHTSRTNESAWAPAEWHR